MSDLKAWYVTDLDLPGYSAVVFAGNADGARSMAINAGGGANKTRGEIHVERKPALDWRYRGQQKMDWQNAGDRIAMVRDAGIVCSYEIADPECDVCPARKWCVRYERECFDE